MEESTFIDITRDAEPVLPGVPGWNFEPSLTSPVPYHFSEGVLAIDQVRWAKQNWVALRDVAR